MKVAVQGCSHGSLSAIYDSIARYEAAKGEKVSLLLLCGDFQALRSTHDFESISVPPKYITLGTFHEYYSGARVAPVLTIVIGGNHEASNYMWELYHGGWLAPNIYYLGAAGSVIVDGLRISGASGIFKPGDYKKGHFEQVPFNRSELRSVYHIREYDVAKLLQLPRESPTVFLSHDWPIGIAKHGNTGQLLKRKPFFRSEVENNTLGSPPLLALLNQLQPEFWFSAHLHVKFAAVVKHRPDDPKTDDVAIAPKSHSAGAVGGAVPKPVEAGNPDEIEISMSDDEDGPPAAGNPDEIAISDDEGEGEAVEALVNPDAVVEGEEAGTAGPGQASVAATLVPTPDASVSTAPLQPEPTSGNPEEIQISDDDFDEPAPAPPAPIVPPQPAPAAAPATSSEGRMTRFLALDKCGSGREFIQFLDLPAPTPSPAPRITFDPHWLAITRALHPYLSTDIFAPPLPSPEIVSALVADELARIETEGLLVPAPLSEADLAGASADAPPPLVWEKGPIDIGRVQQFWPTAPPHGHPGGNSQVWYTNPQTEAFCGMLGIENKVNPRPQ